MTASPMIERRMFRVGLSGLDRPASTSVRGGLNPSQGGLPDGARGRPASQNKPRPIQPFIIVCIFYFPPTFGEGVRVSVLARIILSHLKFSIDRAEPDRRRYDVTR
jgi:hypothetical protein